MARPAANKNDAVFTDIRLSGIRSAEPTNPSSGFVRLYVRDTGSDVALIARLANGTEVTVATLVSGGNLP